MGEDSYRPEDYEKREAKAVEDGKANMSAGMFSRQVGRSGLNATVIEDNDVHPDHYMLRATDGNGTKLFLCSLMDCYDTEGQGLVAMGMNDIATFGRVIPGVVDIYFAVQSGVETEKMGEIMKGIDNALRQCSIDGKEWNYGKLETASLDEMIAGPVQMYGFDMSMQATAFIRKEHMPDFDPQPGHLIVGVGASGLHNNGYTGARTALLRSDVEPRPEWAGHYRGVFGLDSPVPDSDQTVGEALLTPTHLYIRPMAEAAARVSEPQSMFGVNITGYGLKNFNRVGSNVAFVINNPFEPTPINRLLVKMQGYSVEQAYTKFNMGLGFAVVVAPEDAPVVIGTFVDAGLDAKVTGYVDEHGEAEPITLLERGLGEDGCAGKVKVAEFRGYD